ncbi:unnamed protein product [Brassica napus]|uniref:(rape) hypothetical protein n=1 Tax=Brassica napus TaxID=3708 RepID=A0A816LQ82_BRANA|nr:unnamed protein product [Brassica napus]
MGLRKLSRSGCTQLCRNWMLIMGRKGRKQFKEAILSQTRVINFVHKDIGEMFPKWEFDVEDTPTENIIKLMFVKKPWKWTMDYWEVTAKKKVVKEDSPRPRKKARKEASEEAKVHTIVVDAMREGFGTCLKEIKYLSERVEAVEKKVGITTKRKGTSAQNTTPPLKPTLEPGLHLLCFLYVKTCSESVNGTNKGRKSLPVDKGPDVPADASSSKDKAPEPSLQSSYTANSTAKKKLKELADWLKTCSHYRTPLDKKTKYKVAGRLYDLPISRPHIDAWINVLRKRYDANPQHFRSERMCFLDHLFAQQWRFKYKDFKDSEPDQNGTIPSFCQSNKVWGTDIDDVYAPVNYNDTHWIAMWISIPRRHIVVWYSICSSISPEELDVVMEPFLYMVSYLLVDLESFTYERLANIPPARAGDCGANGKTMRDKMAVDIFQELPDAHKFENKDNDANLGAYEG